MFEPLRFAQQIAAQVFATASPLDGSRTIFIRCKRKKYKNKTNAKQTKKKLMNNLVSVVMKITFFKNKN
jgi:predicted Co/Zn/Cd cation transporter (cation efflux family)